jgi:hypothetical protein
VTNEPRSPLERFKTFVSEILTVSKEDVQKAEADRRAAFPPKPPAKDEGEPEPDE